VETEAAARELANAIAQKCRQIPLIIVKTHFGGGKLALKEGIFKDPAHLYPTALTGIRGHCLCRALWAVAVSFVRAGRGVDLESCNNKLVDACGRLTKDQSASNDWEMAQGAVTAVLYEGCTVSRICPIDPSCFLDSIGVILATGDHKHNTNHWMSIVNLDDNVAAIVDDGHTYATGAGLGNIGDIVQRLMTQLEGGITATYCFFPAKQAKE
jgi:hypothetical protein